MAPKRGLGKGLDAMIRGNISADEEVKADNKKEQENVSRETYININEIEPNMSQPRKNFDEDTLHELADSIKVHGIIQPLIVQKKGKLYEIIAGERRWRAARIAGLKEIPVIVKEFSKQEVFEIALIENIQREDLNPIEEATAYQKLIDEFKLKQDDVAERVGKSRTAVTNSMRLLKLDDRVKQMVIEGMLSGGHARTLLSIKDNELQYTIAIQAFDNKLSVRELEKLVKKMLEVSEKEQEKENEVTDKNNDENKDAVYTALEEKMKNILGSKVEIKRKNNNKGKIEIEYYSMDELERIIDMINSIVI